MPAGHASDCALHNGPAFWPDPRSPSLLPRATRWLDVDRLGVLGSPILSLSASMDWLGAPHSITSSARASTCGGMSRPRALAVLRLITSSYFVGACTGRSAGFSPLRIRST